MVPPRPYFFHVIFMVIFSTSSTSRSASSRNITPVIDRKCYDAIRKTVTCTLRKYASSWISEDDINDIVQAVAMRIFEQTDKYDESKGAFSTWCSTVAHNYAIQLGKRMKKAGDRAVRLSGVNSFLEGMDDDEKAIYSSSTKQEDTSFSWLKDELGMHPEESEADYFMMKALDDQAMLRRTANLQEFLDTRLNESEKLMFEMMRDGLSKEEMMEITHKTGGNIDTCKSRLRSKVYNWMKASDYYGVE